MTNNKEDKVGKYKEVDELKKNEFKNNDKRLRVKKIKYIVHITIKDGNSRTLIGIKKIKPTTTHIKVDDNEFLLDINNPYIRKPFERYYLFDVNVGQLAIKDKKKPEINPELAKQIIRNHIISQSLTTLTNKQQKMQIYVAVFFAVFGGIIGWALTIVFGGFL